jgi:tetratricopeptide (TPR) repeat protein
MQGAWMNLNLGCASPAEMGKANRFVSGWVAIVVLCFPLISRPGPGPNSAARVQPSKQQAETAPRATSNLEQANLLAEAKSEADGGSLEKAGQTVRRYLEAHPESADGHFLLGLILFKQGKPRESLSEYTEGAKHHDPGAADLKIVALNYVLLGDYTSADHWLTRSVQGNPKDAQGWYYLGRTKYNENRFEEALSAFQECLKLDPRNVKAEDNLGLSHQALGHTAEALTAFRNAIAWQSQLLKKNSGPYIDLGTLFLEQSQVEEALTYLSEAVAISPEESRAHEQLGKAYSRNNDLEKAQDELEKAVALNPEGAALHFMLGQVYRKRGMSEKAKVELERGAALNASREHPKARQAPE